MTHSLNPLTSFSQEVYYSFVDIFLSFKVVNIGRIFYSLFETPKDILPKSKCFGILNLPSWFSQA